MHLCIRRDGAEERQATGSGGALGVLRQWRGEAGVTLPRKFFFFLSVGQPVTPGSVWLKEGGSIVSPNQKKVCAITTNGCSLASPIPTEDGNDGSVVTVFKRHLMLTVLAATAVVVVSV
ncbi:hypothetical protein TcCL_ESM00612 [Trypanosoma cruzi]|nr:hypothetical protein TcCL_ESM00612 [Trypanosoma cruzi]